MKILHVISSVNPKGGGPVEGIRQLQKPMLREGVDVTVVCCDPPDAPWLKNSGLASVIALGPAHLGYAYCSKLLPWLRANLPREAYAVHGARTIGGDEMGVYFLTLADAAAFLKVFPNVPLAWPYAR